MSAKWLAICLLGLLLARPDQARSVCASGVIFSCPLATDTTDLCSGNSMTMVGTVPFTTVGGRACAGPSSIFNYLKTWSDANTAMTGLASSSLGFSIYLNTLNNGVVFSTNDANAFIQFQPDGSVRWGSKGAGDITASAAGAITTGQWYDMGFVYDGTKKYIYITASVVNGGGLTADGSWATITNGYVMNYGIGALPIAGYICNMTATSNVQTSFPINPIASPTPGATPTPVPRRKPMQNEKMTYTD